MEESWILIDQSTGLHVSWYFWLRVLDEVNRSGRYGDPFGLLILEAEVDGGAPRTHGFTEAAAAVPRCIRSTDLGGLIDSSRVGVLLTRQDAAASRVAADRVLERLEASRSSIVRWRPHLLVFPGDRAAISQILTTGVVDWRALEPLTEQRTA
jgi:hypothetical protein